jgi:membrane protein
MLKLVWKLIQRSLQSWGEDNVTQMAAAIAYYTIFSIPPLLIIATSVAGRIFGTEVAKSQLIAQIGSFVGVGTADFVQSLLENATTAETGTVASIIGIVVLLAGGSGVFYQVQFALNRIWKVPKMLAPSFWKTLKSHSVSYLIILAIGAMFIAILILSTLVSVFIGNMDAITGNVVLISVLNFVIFFITITLLIAIIYRVIPDKSITWKDVWLGAAVTALLFILGKYAIGFYLTFTKSGSTFGTAGALVVLLIWIFYSVQIFLLGAEFTHTYSMRLGSHPGPEAVTLVKG